MNPGADEDDFLVGELEGSFPLAPAAVAPAAGTVATAAAVRGRILGAPLGRRSLGKGEQVVQAVFPLLRNALAGGESDEVHTPVLQGVAGELAVVVDATIATIFFFYCAHEKFYNRPTFLGFCLAAPGTPWRGSRASCPSW